MSATNNMVSPMLTDLYQLTMAYAYWKSGRHEENAVFELFFRKNPFKGEFTIFAGLEEVLRLVSSFRFSHEDIEYLKNGVRYSRDIIQEKFRTAIDAGLVRKSGSGYEQYVFPPEGGSPHWVAIKAPDSEVCVNPPMGGCEDGFFEWLESVDCSRIKIKSFREGSAVFPREPLIRVEGPVAIAQLLETPLLTLVNYPSLIATKAMRMRLAAGDRVKLMEFGLRRAQGPDGGVSASRYSYVGGFDSTSNVISGKLFGIPLSGTHAHSFVSSFSSLEELENPCVKDSEGVMRSLVEPSLRYRKELGFESSNEGELAAFIAYAAAFPDAFLALADTYDIMKSGIPNFLCVALALKDMGHMPLGVRIDSGDLAYFSKEIRRKFREVGEMRNNGFESLTIVASNDIDESTIASLNEQRHEMNSFGIGTHLVTCNGQPALGGVYKLVEFAGNPRIKISQEPEKTTLPCRKSIYRLYGAEGFPLLDLMTLESEKPPVSGEKILCRHPFHAEKRVYVVPAAVEELHCCVWDGRRTVSEQSLPHVREYCSSQIRSLRNDHLRTLNPTPYKVSLSNSLYERLYELRQNETPIATIH